MKSYLILLISLSFRLIAHGQSPLEVKFMAYNLENYVRMERKSVPDAPKPEKEIAALISIIAAEKPDILGVCEMGAPAEFQDFLARLKRAGLDFPYTEHVQAVDTERHLALASRFPIAAHDSQTDLSFDLDGKKQYYKRGILDVTIDVTASYQLHLLGTHLKSKREVPENESLVRRSEAHILRQYAKTVLDKSPDARLLLYGDLNDTIDEASIREIIGDKKQSATLTPFPLADENGEKWTHFWKENDTYSRIDYVMASRTALKDLDRHKTHIPSPENWNTASDHRPLVVVLKVKD